MNQSIKFGAENPKLKLKPIFLCVSAILGVASFSHAEIINTNGAGVMNQNNRPTIVHINKASDKGVSHNIYSKFDVDKNGVILNNSKIDTDTKLGGLINGNLNLANGAAKVIINEVNSNSTTTLNGMVEVAGERAKVIIANPSGITCNSCGFINTKDTTLTTGKPLIANGELLGYNVAKGQIIINKGLESESPTELISRSAIINGQLNSKEIKIVTGNNFVDANGDAQATVAGTGSRPSVGIDVSALGGMYANKITLVSTESGTGVSNQGTISAKDGGLTINSSGLVVNEKNKIESIGDININSSGLTNTALISAQKNINITNTSVNSYLNNNSRKIISTAGEINLKTPTTLLNRVDGQIIAKNNIDIKTIDIQNGTGLIKAETGDVDIDARGTVYQWKRNSKNILEDRIVAGRDINITADRVISEAANIESGRDVNITTTSAIENANTSIVAKRRVNINADTITNKASSIIATNAKSDISASKYINNDANSIISSGRGLNITSAKLVNNGKIISPTNKPNTPPIPTYVTDIKVDTIENVGGMITGDTLNFTSDTIINDQGFIDATKLNVTANTLNNYKGYIRSNKDITLDVKTLSNTYSSYFGNFASKFGLTNKIGGIEVLDGGITVTSDIVSNYYGFIKSRIGQRATPLGGMEFNVSGLFENNYGELNSEGSIAINAKEASNYKGLINTDGKLQIRASEYINNIYGNLKSKNVTELYTPVVKTYDKNETYSLDGTGIIYRPDGLNIIHIKKPSDKGISHNTYQSFNVGEKGVIFNNSDAQSTTQLGGNIYGNQNLAGSAPAKVILNEVVANNISTINGMMEVAGTAAQVIVANASGITCNNCGFINATRGAFVTGTPLVVGNNLIGYNVSKGQITVNKKLTSKDAVDFIARSVLINGDVKANEINISTGSNVFDQQGNVLSTVSGPASQDNYGITIAAKGSLDAEKINLNVNESGRFLSNSGLINAGNNGLTVNAYAVHNTGTIQGKGNLDLTSTGRYTFNNDYGNIISTNGDIKITSNNSLHNRYNGLISAKKDVNLNISENIQNGGGLIKAEQGDINANVDTIYNWASNNSQHGKNRFIAGRDININGGRIVNEQAVMTAGRDFTFTGSELTNRASSAIKANRRVTIDSDYVINQSSTIQAETGRMDITAQKELTNDTKSTISSDKLMNITSPKLTNSGIIVSNNGKSTFAVDNLTNNAGYIKGFNLNIISNYLYNIGGLIKAGNNVVMNADYIANTNASDFSKNTYYLGLPSQKGGIIAENGKINIKGIQLNNASGLIQTNAIFPAAGEADINIAMSNEIVNNYAQIYSAGNLNVSANTIGNYSGIMKADLDLTAKAGYATNNIYGIFNSRNTTKVTSPILSNNNGKITGNKVIIETN